MVCELLFRTNSLCVIIEWAMLYFGLLLFIIVGVVITCYQWCQLFKNFLLVNQIRRMPCWLKPLSFLILISMWFAAWMAWALCKIVLNKIIALCALCAAPNTAICPINCQKYVEYWNCYFVFSLNFAQISSCFCFSNFKHRPDWLIGYKTV